MSPQEAVKAAYKKYPVMVSMKKELGGELVKAARKGGADDVDAKELRAAMAKAWAQDGLTLSDRTTKGNAWVVTTVSQTIEAAVKKGGSVMAMAKEIFDGYGKAGYLEEQDLPQFLDELVGLGRACKEDRHFKIALREAERSASKLTTKGLQAAYNGILKAVEAGNRDRVAKAIYVAVQEKTRYFAERIARTEKARAYADGMMYKYAVDSDCVAFKWKLSTRHPCDDVCDLYAKADLWGMGEGIFPKDKVPTLPVHPNCMCRLIPVYAGSKRLKGETPVDRTREGGAEYIKSLPEIARKSLLGGNGGESVMKGADWRHYARGYSDKKMQSRVASNGFARDITNEVLANASPGRGGIYVDENYAFASHKEELEVAKWIQKTIGGDIEIKNEKLVYQAKSPDYYWQGKHWDLKTLSTEKAADSAVRHGIKQIAQKPGGIILLIKDCDMDIKKAEKLAVARVKRSAKFDMRLILIRGDRLYKIIQYKKQVTR